MTNRIACDDKAWLLAYLYDEVTPEERRLAEAHLAACPVCRREVADLRGVRVGLATWTPPEPVPGFRLVRDRGEDPQPAPWWRAPAWAFAWAAAAVLVLAAAAAVAHLDVRYESGAWAVRTGWRRAAASAIDVAPGAPWREDLEALEARLRRTLVEAAASPAASPAASGARVDEAALLRRVAALIDASERRQQRELALRMAELVRDLDVQRRADWARIQEGFGRLEQLAGASAAQQRDLWNYVNLMRVSQRDPQ